MEVLFDARGPLPQFAFWCLAIGLAALIVALIGARSRKPSAADEAFSARMRNGVAVVVGLLMLGAGAWPFGLALKARADFAAGRVATVQGCASGYARIVHPERHNVSDTYVSVGGRALHFNSSPWLPGYHDDPATVGEGQRLTAYMVGDRLVRLERLSSDCTG